MNSTLRHLAAPLILAAAAGLIQAWLMARAATPAQDAVRYVASAQSIQRDGLLNSLRADPEQPLFPLSIYVCHAALMAVGACDDRDWGWCAQAAAAVPLILAAPLVYWIARRAIGVMPALVAGVVFVCLPSIARLGADGLSDSTHLLFYLAAVGCITSYWNRTQTTTIERPWSFRRDDAWLAGFGACAGVALWVRCEAIPLAPAALLAIFASTRDRWNVRVGRTAVAGLSIACGLLAALVPYLAVCDDLQPREAVARLLGSRRADETRALNDLAPATGTAAEIAVAEWRLADGREMSFARKDPSQRTRQTGWAFAAGQLGRETVGCLHGAGLVFLAWGWRRSSGMKPALRAWSLVLTAMHLGCVLYVGATRGYMSDRHIVPWVAAALPWCALGVLAAAEATVRAARFLFAGRSWAMTQEPRLAGAVACALIALACLPSLAVPLHASRIGHRLAADWVRDRTEDPQAVLDSRGWTALYSGRKTYRYELSKTAFADPHLEYLVLEAAEVSSTSLRGESLRRILHDSAEPMIAFPAEGPEAFGVVVYRWRPNRFSLARGR